MILYRISSTLLLFLWKFFFRLEVKGKENIPRTGGFILASNHLSYLDPTVLGAACCPRTLNFMARHELFSIPILGAFIRAVGAIPIKRNFADITSIKEALRYLRKEQGIVLFPEGTRSSGELLSNNFQPGIGLIAIRAQAPVIPALINGTQKALARHARFIKPAKVRVYFGKPIYPKRTDGKDNYEYFANRVMHEINRLSQERGGS
ncbi:MAG: lysophospholipid acyltransferase family protein [Candidatus Omnitrophota bacterium]|jgi:1-acyl-sn-glycerol-3-phosphate acyltransferase